MSQKYGRFGRKMRSSRLPTQKMQTLQKKREADTAAVLEKNAAVEARFNG